VNGWQAVVTAVVPSIGVGVLFWVAIRALLNADANERRATAQFDAAERAAAANNDTPHDT
jgi:threonine/homoserine/homoserine lactone efflux protein